MFSTTTTAELTLSKIAEFVALEEAPADPDLRQQLRAQALIVLKGAWWAGELIGQESERRLKILQGLFSRFRSEIAFVIPGQDPPLRDTELPDRSLYVDPRLIVPIPSEDPSNWTDASCEAAFKGLSAGWQLLIGRTEGEERAYSAFEPAVRSVTVSRIEFFRWLKTKDFETPKFWLSSKAVEAELETHGVAELVEPQTLISSAATQATPGVNAKRPKSRGPKPAKQLAVIGAMRADLKSGELTTTTLDALLEKELVERYGGYSRTTMRAARKDILKEFLNVPNSPVV